MTSANIRQKWETAFLNVTSAEAWFNYMLNVFIPLTFPKTWYNGDALTTDELGWPGGLPEMYRLLGSVRLRQVRVRNNTCGVPSTLAAAVPFCFGPFSPDNEDQAPFGRLGRYTYTPASVSGTMALQGQAGFYSGGGYILGLPYQAANNTQDLATLTLLRLRDDRWIDRQTRAVFVDWNMFNPATGTLVVCRLSAELAASGGAFPRMLLRVVRAEQLYPTPREVLNIALEAVLLLLLVAYMVFELRLLLRVGAGAYLSSFWGVYDVVNFILFFVSYGARFTALTMAAGLKFPPDGGGFVSYDNAAYYVVQWKNLMAINAIVTWSKMLKYLRHVPFMEHLIRVVFTALPDLVQFAGAGVFLFVGFALAHLLAYGDAMPAYQTLPDAMLGIYRQMLGDFDVDDMVATNRVLGPALFLLWTLLATVLLLNMFVAIVVDSYGRMEREMEKVEFLAFVDAKLLPPVKSVLNRLGRIVAEPDEDPDQTDPASDGPARPAAGDAAAADAARGRELLATARVAEEPPAAPRPPPSAGSGVMVRAAAEVGGADGGGGGGGASGGGGGVRGGGGGGAWAAETDERLDLVLQAVLTLSKEVRVLSRRVRALSDTAGASGGGDGPSLY